MLKKPNILVVGSFMMDLIASTKRAPLTALPIPAGERAPIRRSSVPAWVPT